MAKKNKVIYSDVQPNAKEAGIWVNPNDGNVKVEKGGKWVDDNIGTPGGGGGQLDGEYFLARPNGYYWKFKCADHMQRGFPIIVTATEEEIATMKMAYEMGIPGFFIYDAITNLDSPGATGKEALFDTTLAIMAFCTDAAVMLMTENPWQPGSSTITAWREAGDVSIQGHKFANMIEFIKTIISQELGDDNVTDETALQFLSDEFGIVPVTKEEWDSWVKE